MICTVAKREKKKKHKKFTKLLLQFHGQLLVKFKGKVVFANANILAMKLLPVSVYTVILLRLNTEVLQYSCGIS